MTDDAGDFAVTQFLGHGGGLARVASVVLGNQFKLDLLAANQQVLGIEFVNRKAHAVFSVLTNMRNTPRRRTGVGDFDGLHFLGLGDGRSQRQ